MILNCAGTDGTILFHSNHVNYEKAEKYLKPYKIGTIDKPISPKMGEFYLDLRKRVYNALKEGDKYKPPWQAGALFCFEYILHMTAVWYFMHGYVSALCVVGPLYHRLYGWAHVLGHNGVFKNHQLNYFALILLFFSPVQANPFPVTVYAPPFSRNRFKTHDEKGARQSQSNRLDANMYSQHHIALHHVFGALAEDDLCHEVVTSEGRYRMEERAQYNMEDHKDQAKVNFFEELVLLMATVIVSPMIGFGALYFCDFSTWCKCALCYMPVASIYNKTSAILFYAQHKWDTNPSYEELHADWGKVSLETSTSYWPRAWERFCPFLFHLFNGGTIDYHLEHTMFPTLCWWHYHQAARIIEATAKDHGLSYNKFDGFLEVLNSRANDLKKYSTPSVEKKKLK